MENGGDFEKRVRLVHRLATRLYADNVSREEKMLCLSMIQDLTAGPGAPAYFRSFSISGVNPGPSKIPLSFSL